MIFQEGFKYSFDESKCESCGGKCCTGESGNIFVNQEEIRLLREHFKLDELEFRERFLRKVGFKFSLKEKEFEDGFACIFLIQRGEIVPFMPCVLRNAKPFPFGTILKHIKRNWKKNV